jgi:hypothetical protein
MLNFQVLFYYVLPLANFTLDDGPNRVASSYACISSDEGFTQTRDTVGTGTNSCAERASPSLKRRSAMR